MNMEIQKDALNWYKDELELENGDQVRFFVRYGGCSSVQKAFPSVSQKMNPRTSESALK